MRSWTVCAARSAIQPRSGWIRAASSSPRDLDLCAYVRGVVLDFLRPGTPTDNAFIERFNGKFRAECLNQHWFLSIDDAVGKCETWRRDYNEVRPHSAIGNKPPISLVNQLAANGPL
ncbi:transposase [Sphingomonas glacialis]|uniref:Transposase n=1 Tax=Sphingomonas glacialis TaxID=658225 RepID=A0A502FRB8_9SPHN|nr:transposase [Sphingomonas glacialis]